MHNLRLTPSANETDQVNNLGVRRSGVVDAPSETEARHRHRMQD